MALPNAEMLAVKQQWDAILGPTFVDLHSTEKDFGYFSAAERHMPFNTWQLSYGFANGPFQGTPQKVVSIWQKADNPNQFINNQMVNDQRYASLTLTAAALVPVRS